MDVSTNVDIEMKIMDRKNKKRINQINDNVLNSPVIKTKGKWKKGKG